MSGIFGSVLKKIKGIALPADINIAFENENSFKKIENPLDKDGPKLTVVFGNDPIKGTISIAPIDNKKLEHDGIECSFVGRIEINGEKNQENVFISVSKELEGKGILTEATKYKFDFSHIKREYETYYGTNANLRYFIQVRIARGGPFSISSEKEFYAVNLLDEPEENKIIRLEVGVKGYLHIEFEFSKSKLHIEDVLVGKVTFINTKLKVKNMEIGLIKKETTFQDKNAWNENETLIKFEIMDGAPVKGEVIPIRLFFRPLNLTPSYQRTNAAFQVKYFINIVIFDEEDRRYFKQHEIIIWRKEFKEAK